MRKINLFFTLARARHNLCSLTGINYVIIYANNEEHAKLPLYNYGY